MQDTELKELVGKIQNFNCKFHTIEVKSANLGYPKRLYDKGGSDIEVFINIVIKTNTADYKSRLMSLTKACSVCRKSINLYLTYQYQRP